MNSVYQSAPQLNFDVVGRQALGLWRQILPASGVPVRFLNNQHGPCPACGGRDRFRFDDKNGTGSFICNQCGAGDGFALLQVVKNWTPGEALKAVASILELNRADLTKPGRQRPRIATRPDMPPAINEQVRKANAALWSAGCAITPGDPVYTYLTKARRLCLDVLPHTLRHHPAVHYYDQDRQLVGYFPAMLALVVNLAGEMVAIHKTYLTEQGRKASVPEPKKLSRSIYPRATQGAAIRLHEPGKVLGVAEGIETALACYCATGVPTWATCNAANMAALAVPPTVHEVVIFADHDKNGKGQAAAKVLAKRLLAEGRKVKVLLPQSSGTDWCDVVTASMEVQE